MDRKLHIQLIDRIKKPETGNRFTDKLVGIGCLILLPVALALALLFMIILGIFTFIQKLFSSKDKNHTQAEEHETDEQWIILTQQNNLKILQKYQGETRFGPVYMHLKSDPSIDFFTDKIFGDWFFYYDDGIFLQQWDSISEPDTSVLFVDTITFNVRILQKNIPSINWDMIETDNKKLLLTCDTGNELLKYNIEIFPDSI